MADTPKPLTDMTDAELAAEEAKLAEAHEAVRLAQNAVRAEIETRIALGNVSGSTREALKLRLGGTVAPSGKANPS